MKFNVALFSILKSEAKLRIVRFLLSHQAAMSEREMAAILKVSHMSVNRVLQELAELYYVDYAVIGKAHLWKVNTKSYSYQMFAQIIKDMETWPDPLAHLKQMILKGLPLKYIERIIIFGSIAKKTETVNSDIDVFIMTSNKDGQARVEKDIDQLSHQCLEAFGNRLSPYVLTQQQYQRKQKRTLISEINQGIQIYPSQEG